MFKQIFLSLAISVAISVAAFCGSEDSSRSYDMPFISALKQAKGKNKEVHKIAGIDFIYCIAAKKCHRYNDLKRNFAKYNITPYRFTSFSPSHINADTMHRTCLRGSRHLHRYTGQTMVIKKGKFVLAKRKLAKRSNGYVHTKMSLKSLSRALSHISIIHDALKSGYENIWIMDSATKLRVDPNILSRYIARADQEIPDWTSIYTDISERDASDYPEPIGHFYDRADLDFLDTENYFEREEQDYDPYDDGDDENGSSHPGYNYTRHLERNDGLEKGKLNDPPTRPAKTDPARVRAGFSVENQRPTTGYHGYPDPIKKFTHVGLLKGSHSYILNRKGMKLIMDWYLDHKIFIPYAQEIQIIPGMYPYCTPEPVTKNTNRG